MNERYNREKHCGFGEPIWNFNDILGEEGNECSNLQPSLPLSSLIDNTINTNYINVREDMHKRDGNKHNT